MFNSSLHDETTFYYAFLRDLEASKEEVYIESPFITSERVNSLKPIFEKLIKRGVKVYILTRDPAEHDERMAIQSENEITYFECLGIQVFLAKNHEKKPFHRKLAIIDRKILWEGSLNILSQNHSREIMRRIENREVTLETMNFLKLSTFL
jgi:phosphatidylserine/phosphatidylglycerophosphate/cardiolipin synthase-like enzyme